MATVRDFRELRVYVVAFEAAMTVFDLSKRSPPDERFSLTDQIRRSSRSVTSNIAEAWRKRRYPSAFVSKLSDADAEAAETLVWLEYCLKCNYFHANDHAVLSDRYGHINAQLCRMMDHPEQWCTVKPR